MNQRGNKIEDAYNLVKNISFAKVVQTLEKVQTPELFRQYWGRDIDIPDKNEVHEARKEKKAGLEALVNGHTSWADQAAGLEDRLFIIARNILRDKQSIAKLKAPDFDILNMQLIGQLWADADILLKYYPVYKGGALPEALPTGFKTNLAPDKAGALCDALKQALFIAQDTEPETLKAVLCGLPIEKRVQWVKLQYRNKKELHKKSLPELIGLLGLKTEYSEYHVQFAACFSDNNGAPMIVNSSSWNDNKSGADQRSEYYKQLADIVKQLKK